MLYSVISIKARLTMERNSMIIAHREAEVPTTKSIKLEMCNRN